jgi:hypothetical protein
MYPVMNIVQTSQGGKNHFKVPKCEIFDLLDISDFYTLKLLWVGDFRIGLE